MADFCSQCNIDMFFGPYSDFDYLPEGKTFLVLCEGCGITHVRDGWCEDPHCRAHHEPDEGPRKVYEAGRRYISSRRGPMGRLWRVRDRLLGTPWEPGLIHDVRLWYHLWQDRRRNRPTFPFEVDPPKVIYLEPLHGEDQTTRIVDPTPYHRIPEDPRVQRDSDDG